MQKKEKREVKLTKALMGNYKEYDLEVEGTKYCIIQERSEMALLKLEPETGWVESEIDPLDFILKNNLELGE